MALDVAVPDPPDLSNRGVPSEFEAVDEAGSVADFRREEIETVFHDGAWQEAFDEWCGYTDMTESEFEVLSRLGLIRELDFYWDPESNELTFDAPPLPPDWRERVGQTEASADLESTLELGLQELGRTVVEWLEQEYIDWDEESGDLVWEEETFGHGTGRE